MASLFNRKRQSEQVGATLAGETAEPENRDGARLERFYSRWVPASVRTPDAMRIGVPPVDETEGPDEDVQFIATLLDEVERAPQPAQRFTPAPQPRIERIRLPEEPAVRRETAPPGEQADDLRHFREMKEDRERTSLAPALKVADVDMADLLEALETTSIALRRRRAA